MGEEASGHTGSPVAFPLAQKVEPCFRSGAAGAYAPGWRRGAKGAHLLTHGLQRRSMRSRGKHWDPYTVGKQCFQEIRLCFLPFFRGSACRIFTILLSCCNFLSCSNLVATFPTTNIFGCVCTRIKSADRIREEYKSEHDAES